MHYNAARFYSELENASVPRFARVLSGSFGLSALLYTVIASAGYLTFGGASDGYILNDYAANDGAAVVCRLAVGFSTLLIFPLAFVGFRDGVLDIFQGTAENLSSRDFNTVTAVLLAAITLMALPFP